MTTYEALTTTRQAKLIDDVFAYSGGHMTVNDLVTLYGYHYDTVGKIMEGLIKQGLAHFDWIQADTRQYMAVCSHRGTLDDCIAKRKANLAELREPQEAAWLEPTLDQIKQFNKDLLEDQTYAELKAYIVTLEDHIISLRG